MKIRGRTVGTTMPRPDWSQKDPRKANYILNKPDEIVCEASGSVVSVCDSSNQKLHNLTLYGKTTQNGTPTPEVPVEPVSAGASGTINTTVCGKNLFDPEKAISNATVEADGSVLSGEAGGCNTSDFIPVVPGEKYSISKTSSHRGKYYNSAKEPLSNVFDFNAAIGATITPPQNACYIRFSLYPNSVGQVQVEKGAVATDFEPYKGQTITASTPNGLPGIPVSSGGNYTDENGQAWVCDEIDFARGVYVQRVGQYTFTGKETANAYGNVNANGFGRWQINIGANAAFSDQAQWVASCCNKYMSTTGNVLAGLVNGGGTDYKFAFVGEQHVVFSTDSTDSASFTAEITGTTILYQIATPIETAMSAEELAAYAALHSNKPNTTVYNDAGAGLSVKYAADPKNYIDNRFTDLQNAILSAGANI